MKGKGVILKSETLDTPGGMNATHNTITVRSSRDMVDQIVFNPA